MAGGVVVTDWIPDSAPSARLVVYKSNRSGKILDSPMNILESIETRRSIKHFDPAHVMPEAEVDRLLELARLAPSSFNLQNYRFVLVRDPALRRQIRVVSWDQAQVTDSSLLVVMCADLRAHEHQPERYWSHAPQPVRDLLVPALKGFYAGNDQLIRDEAMRSTALGGMTLMLAANPLRPRAFGGKGAEGLKKEITSSRCFVTIVSPTHQPTLR